MDKLKIQLVSLVRPQVAQVAGAFLFVLFLRENDLLEQSQLNDDGLVVLALLIAESDPKQKALLVRLIINLLKFERSN